MLGFQAIREQARRDLHAAFAVSGQYNDTDTILSVRWHDRFVKAVGDVPGGGWAEVLENIDQIIFNEEELTALSITPVRGDTITLTDYANFVLVLDTKMQRNGPVTIGWNVTRPRPT